MFNTIKKYLDDQSMRKLVLPKAKSLFMKSTSVRVSKMVMIVMIAIVMMVMMMMKMTTC